MVVAPGFSAVVGADNAHIARLADNIYGIAGLKGARVLEGEITHKAEVLPIVGNIDHTLFLGRNAGIRMVQGGNNSSAFQHADTRGIA